MVFPESLGPTNTMTSSKSTEMSSNCLKLRAEMLVSIESCALEGEPLGIVSPLLPRQCRQEPSSRSFKRRSPSLSASVAIPGDAPVGYGGEDLRLLAGPVDAQVVPGPRGRQVQQLLVEQRSA